MLSTIAFCFYREDNTVNIGSIIDGLLAGASPFSKLTTASFQTNWCVCMWLTGMRQQCTNVAGISNLVSYYIRCTCTQKQQLKYAGEEGQNQTFDLSSRYDMPWRKSWPKGGSVVQGNVMK